MPLETANRRSVSCHNIALRVEKNWQRKSKLHLNCDTFKASSKILFLHFNGFIITNIRSRLFPALGVKSSG